jgi:hypothetical protein
VFLIEEIKMEDQFSEVDCADWHDEVYSSKIRGVTLAYAMNTDDRDKMLCRYVLTPRSSSSKDDSSDTRGYREMSQRNGEQVPPIKADALHYQLFILPGALMGPADVVKTLRAFIAQIEKRGMFVGKYKDAYIRERIPGSGSRRVRHSAKLAK